MFGNAGAQQNIHQDKLSCLEVNIILKVKINFKKQEEKKILKATKYMKVKFIFLKALL